MAADDVDETTSRSVVKTYVPEYQKDEWKEHAADLDMTQSEYVRTMVQAGRRGFLDDESPPVNSQVQSGDSSQSAENPSTDPAPDGDSIGEVSAEFSITDRAFRLIDEREPVAWEDLYEALIGDVESDLDESLQALQAENRITYSGRQGGYVVSEADDAS